VNSEPHCGHAENAEKNPLLAGKDFSREIFAVNPGLDFHREGAKENAKDFSLVAALLLCVHLCSSVVSFCASTVSSFRLRT